MKKNIQKFQNYFGKELLNLKSYESDGLLKLSDDNIILTALGEHFSQIANVFDTYNDQEFYKKAI